GAALSPNHTPGVVIDVMAVATPALSMSSIDRAGVQLRVGGWRICLGASSATYRGGARWWWTSMRCGVAGTPAGACAADRRAGTSAPAPRAARPATNARRDGRHEDGALGTRVTVFRMTSLHASRGAGRLNLPRHAREPPPRSDALPARS